MMKICGNDVKEWRSGDMKEEDRFQEVQGPTPTVASSFSDLPATAAASINSSFYVVTASADCEKYCWQQISALAELGCLFRKEQSSTYRYSSATFPRDKEGSFCSITIHWRHKICDWYYEFIDHYNFDRELVGIALSYFDRYISNHASNEDVHTKDKYQIVAVTCLYLVIKIHSMSEACLVESRSRALSRLLYGHVDPQTIYQMERNILQTLDWGLNPPTMHQFALNFSKLHPLGDVNSGLASYLYEATRYQVELAVFIPELLERFKPSVVVCAAMENVLEKIAVDNPQTSVSTEMTQCFETLFIADQSVTIDPVAVAQCKLTLSRLCPQLPDLDYFGINDTDQLDLSASYDMHEYSSAVPSPKNVIDY